RTSTHCFNKQAGKWEKLNFNYDGDDYRGGLGEQIFGNTWNKQRGQSHYGGNPNEGGTISAVASAKDHPILTGVEPMHTYSGAYKSQPPADATPLLEVQVLNTFHTSNDKNTDKPIVNAGWAREFYMAPSGTKKQARTVYTSYGASEDLLDANARRFLVNAALWAGGWEDAIKADLDVSLVGGFQPSPYTTGSFARTGVKPQDLAGWDSTVMPEAAGFLGLDFDEISSKKAPRLLRVLTLRPDLVDQIKKQHPDFTLEKLEAAKKK
ncbi:MAG: hypothetical protein AAF226_14020, partial [Verrucomicrobiota bacterium]